MLSKDQADRIADQILQQARSAKHSRPAPVVLRVPLLFRCRELRSLPQLVQKEVVREAMQETLLSPAYIVVFLVWLLLIVALWIFVTSSHGRASLTPLIAMSWLVPLLTRAFIMRRRVRTIAIQRQSLAPIDER